jgi:hypothetical protein
MGRASEDGEHLREHIQYQNGRAHPHLELIKDLLPQVTTTEIRKYAGLRQWGRHEQLDNRTCVRKWQQDTWARQCFVMCCFGMFWQYIPSSYRFLYPVTKTKIGCLSRLLTYVVSGFDYFYLDVDCGPRCEPTALLVVTSREGRLATSQPTSLESEDSELVTSNERIFLGHLYSVPSSVPFQLV